MVKDIYVHGMPTIYWADDDGEIINKNTGNPVYGWIDMRGYKVVSICINPGELIRKYKKFSVHRLIAETFIPNPENKPQVNHMDGNKLHNWTGNLEWVTNKENYDHARNMGLIKTGEDLSYATVENRVVERICELLEAGWRNVDIIQELGLPNDHYGKSLITRIRTGKQWKDISSKYEFIKTGSLKKYPDELVHEICKCLEKGMPTREIFDTVGISHMSDYPKFTGLVGDIRSRRTHKYISENYVF